MSLPATNQPEIFRGVDAITGDWQAGQGFGSYATAENAINLDIRTALQCFLGDWFADLTFGIDWVTYLGNRGTENAILLAVRQMLSSRYGVVVVNALSASLNSLTRSLTLVYNVTTIFSKTVLDSVAVNIPLAA